jgi:hypothetical protein
MVEISKVEHQTLIREYILLENINVRVFRAKKRKRKEVSRMHGKTVMEVHISRVQ